jgi:hypothetical protein
MPGIASQPPTKAPAARLVPPCLVTTARPSGCPPSVDLAVPRPWPRRDGWRSGGENAATLNPRREQFLNGVGSALCRTGKASATPAVGRNHGRTCSRDYTGVSNAPRARCCRCRWKDRQSACWGSVVGCLAGLDAQRCGGVARRLCPSQRRIRWRGRREKRSVPRSVATHPAQGGPKRERGRGHWQRGFSTGYCRYRPASRSCRPGRAVPWDGHSCRDVEEQLPGGCGSGLAKSKRCVFGLVQLQCTGKSIENGIGHTA